MKNIAPLILLATFILISGSARGVDITSCTEIATPNQVYNLTQNITDTQIEKCINITADNTTFDCNGYTIDGYNASFSNQIYGIFISGNGTVVRNCNVRDFYFGIFVNASGGNNITDNYVFDNFHGIGVYSNSTDNRVANNTINGNTQYGIYVAYDSRRNLVENNVVNSSGEYGIFVYMRAANNTLRNNTIVSSSLSGIFVYNDAGNNTFSGNFLQGNTEGIYIHDSDNNHFYDTSVSSNNYDVHAAGYSSNNYLVNLSHSKSKVFVSGQARIWFSWHLDIYVQNRNMNPLQNVNVTAFDNNNSQVFSLLTNSSGYIQRQNLTEYYQNATGSYYKTNYTINVVLYSSTNTTGLNLTTNQLLNLTLEFIPSVSQPVTYNENYTQRNNFNPEDKVVIRADVTDYDGGGDIGNVNIYIRDPEGVLKADNQSMTNVSTITNGYTYEYNYTIPSTAEQAGMWVVNVTARDSSGLLGFSSTTFEISPLSLQVKLVLNNTGASVYIPGTGETSVSDLTYTQYTSPSHYYLVSYLGNAFSGLVFSRQNPRSIFVNKTGSTYTLGTALSLENSRVFLVFSKGDWREVNTKISSIEKGEFLTNPSPSFSYGLGDKYPLKVVLEYSDINVIANETEFGKGYYNLVLENVGVVSGKPGISIKKS